MANPCDRVEPPKSEAKESKFLTEDEIKCLLKCLSEINIKYRTAIMLSLTAGLREGEVAGIDKNDLDLEACCVKIEKDLKYVPGMGIFEGRPKTPRSKRIVYFPPLLVPLFKELEKERDELRCKLGDQWVETGKVFPNTTGGFLSPKYLGKKYKDIIRKYNLNDSHFHLLRHTAASVFLADGADIATVSSQFGHALTEITARVYLHAEEKAKARLSGMMQQTIKNLEQDN